jgi:hypothetical protein
LTATLAETYNSHTRIHFVRTGEMKIDNRSASSRTRTPLARLLACVLVVGIIYSATFGAIHSHGIVLSTLGADVSAIPAGQTASLTLSTLDSHPDGNECLICVLHRQFSSSTVHAPLVIVGPSTQIAPASAPTVFYYSRLSGRAPPQAQA